jgi:methylmalonyl-CoA/ethylmalonyl-CoA epimerase
MSKVKRINHIAILVEDIQTTLAFWQDGLGLSLAGLEDVPKEGSRVAFLPVGESEVELVQPTTADSGLTRYLEKRGPGMHHLCLEVDDIEGMLARLKEHGIQLINEQPQAGMGGRRYAFIHPKSANGVMVELYELPRDIS